MDPRKVKAILNWPTPKNQGDVKSFHGLGTFYRNFIKNFGHVCALIIDAITGGRKKIVFGQMLLMMLFNTSRT